MAKAGVNIPIVSDWDSKGIKRAMEDFKKLETTGQKVSFAMEKALVPATAAVAGLATAAGLATKAAAEDASQQAELNAKSVCPRTPLTSRSTRYTRLLTHKNLPAPCRITSCGQHCKF